MTWTPLAVKIAIFCAIFLLGFIVLVQIRASGRETSVEAQYPPSGQFVVVDGTRVHMNIMGEGPDIVMIHGASGSLRDFTFQLAEKLSGRYRVIAVDRPGHGWSDRPPGYGGVWNTADEPPALQAGLLRKAALTLGVEKPILFGHSYGGAVALAWALDAPDETAGLVLVSAASNRWEGKLGLLYQINSTALGSAILIPILTAFVPHAYIERVLSEIFAPQDAPQGYTRHFGSDMTLRRKALRANAQQVNALKPYVTDMAKRYPTLTVPVEILHGTEDVIVPLQVHSEPLSHQIPGAVLTTMQGVGHMPHHVAPEELIAAVDRVAARAGLR